MARRTIDPGTDERVRKTQRQQHRDLVSAAHRPQIRDRLARGRQPLLRRSSGLTLLELVVVLALLVALASMTVPLFSDVTDEGREKATNASMRELQTVIVGRYTENMRRILTWSSNDGVQIGLPGPDPNNSTMAPPGRQQQPQLHFLYVNPNGSDPRLKYISFSQKGWNGPYLTSCTGLYPGFGRDTAVSRGFDDRFGYAGTEAAEFRDADQTVLDGWGNPIVIRFDATNAKWMLVSAGIDGRLDETPNLNSTTDITLSLP